MQVCKEFLKTKAHITLEDTQHSIVSGIYISPFTESIMKDNKDILDGLILDTTWHVLPYYVTSILMCSICNVGVPVAFCFGKGETASLYEYFFQSFAKYFGIELHNYIIESDQGIAFKFNNTEKK